jgi:hypothetical protein
VQSKALSQIIDKGSEPDALYDATNGDFFEYMVLCCQDRSQGKRL